MYIDLFELMEDDGEYTCVFNKNRDNLNGHPYITVFFLNKDNTIEVRYKGELIFSRDMDERYDDGVDIHIKPPTLTVEDLKDIKAKINTFWTNKRSNYYACSYRRCNYLGIRSSLMVFR